MYQVQFLAGHGLGAVAKGDGGYACNATICYSYKSPGTNQLFIRLQELLNKSAQKLNIKQSVKADGLIGANTVKIAAAVSDKLGQNARYLFSVVSLEGAGGGTKEALAQRADVLVPELAMFVGETIGPVTAGPFDPYPTGAAVPTGVNVPQTAPIDPATSMPYGDQPAYPTAGTHFTVPQPAVTTTASSYQPPVINVMVPGSGSGVSRLPSNTGPMIGIAAVILAVGGAIAYAIHAKKNA